MSKSLVAITGNTYPVKDQLKALGAKWNGAEGAWMISESKAAKAREIVASAGPAQPRGFGYKSGGTTHRAAARTKPRNVQAPRQPERAALTLEEYTALAASQGRTVLMLEAPGHGGQTLIFTRQVGKGGTVENGEIINHKKFGRLMVYHCTRAEYISEDHIEDMDAWADYPKGRGWYCSYYAVRVSDTAEEIADAAAKAQAEIYAKAAAAKAAADREARIKANEARLLEIIEQVKASPETGGGGGMMKLWGDWAGPRLLGFDGGLLYCSDETDVTGPIYQDGSGGSKLGHYIGDRKLAAEAFALCEMTYRELI